MITITKQKIKYQRKNLVALADDFFLNNFETIKNISEEMRLSYLENCKEKKRQYDKIINCYIDPFFSHISYFTNELVYTSGSYYHGEMYMFKFSYDGFLEFELYHIKLNKSVKFLIKVASN